MTCLRLTPFTNCSHQSTWSSHVWVKGLGSSWPSTCWARLFPGNTTSLRWRSTNDRRSGAGSVSEISLFVLFVFTFFSNSPLAFTHSMVEPKCTFIIVYLKVFLNVFFIYAHICSIWNVHLCSTMQAGK